MNEIEQKEIEEMAKATCTDMFKGLKSCEECSQFSKCISVAHARAFYNAGYRNVKDKVVLDKEEYEKLKTYETLQKVRDDMGLDYSHGREEGYTKARKETAREIIEMFADRNYITEKDLINAIAQRYGAK